MDPADDEPSLTPVPRAPQRWGAVLLGASSGLLVAALAIAVYSWWGGRPPADLPPHHDTAAIDLFRLPWGGEREAILVPAGPDAIGEPLLAASLFPGESPPRELASLVVANVGREGAWDVDLVREPLRCRAGGGDWEPLGLLDGVGERARGADRLRLRALGGEATAVSVAPGTLVRLLVALPPRRKLADLTDVEWGGRPLTRDRLDLERVRRFREDPSASLSGR